MAEPNGNVVGTGYDQTLKRVLTRKDLIIYGIAFMTPIAPAYIYGVSGRRFDVLVYGKRD